MSKATSLTTNSSNRNSTCQKCWLMSSRSMPPKSFWASWNTKFLTNPWRTTYSRTQAILCWPWVSCLRCLEKLLRSFTVSTTNARISWNRSCKWCLSTSNQSMTRTSWPLSCSRRTSLVETLWELLSSLSSWISFKRQRSSLPLRGSTIVTTDSRELYLRWVLHIKFYTVIRTL